MGHSCRHCRVVLRSWFVPARVHHLPRWCMSMLMLMGHGEPIRTMLSLHARPVGLRWWHGMPQRRVRVSCQHADASARHGVCNGGTTRRQHCTRNWRQLAWLNRQVWQETPTFFGSPFHHCIFRCPPDTDQLDLHGGEPAKRSVQKHRVCRVTCMRQIGKVHKCSGAKRGTLAMF